MIEQIVTDSGGDGGDSGGEITIERPKLLTISLQSNNINLVVDGTHYYETNKVLNIELGKNGQSQISLGYDSIIGSGSVDITFSQKLFLTDVSKTNANATYNGKVITVAYSMPYNGVCIYQGNIEFYREDGGIGGYARINVTFNR